MVVPERPYASGGVVGVAGGPDKFAVVLGALRGRLVHVLITDAALAARLLQAAEPATTGIHSSGPARATAAT